MLTNFSSILSKPIIGLLSLIERHLHGNIEVKLQNIDGSSYLLEAKDHIKYLGVMIDE